MDVANNQDDDVKKLEAELKNISDDVVKDRERFEKNTNSIVDQVENDAEISDETSAEDEEIKKLEEDLGEKMDEAIIDFATKEE